MIATVIVIAIVMVNEMLKLGRVCIVFGMECNLHCKYCYRDIRKLNDIPSLTNEFKDYLRNLDPSWCTAVCASGGEPLLYFKKIQEAFDCVPKNVHKKIMTNGTLLTQEIVNYINDNNIELHFSHDGEMTEYLRGIDVLKDEKICNLIRQVNILRVVPVITSLNCDVVKCYEYTNKLLKRDDMIYAPSVVFDTGYNRDLIDGFDYDMYTRTYLEYCMLYRRKTPYYSGTKRSNGFNFLPDGTIVGMSTMERYGTFLDTKEMLIKVKEAHKESDFCKNKKCNIRADCMAMTQTASHHVCRIEKIHRDITQYFRNMREEKDVYGI